MATLKKGWNLAVLEACLRESPGKDQTFTNKGLIKNQLPHIARETQTQGKTPQQTMSRTLQELRDIGFISFLKPGVYQLKPLTIESFQKQEAERPGIRKKASKGEKLIYDLLSDLKIPFVCEKTYADLKDKQCLRFDFHFTFLGREICIEFDGEQHRRPVELFGGEEAHKKLVIHDQMKDEYCKKNDIILIRVSDLDREKALDKIETVLLHVIKESTEKES